MDDEAIKVYIKVDSNNCITDINSSIFLSNTTDWIQIDEGTGDKYAHAQNNYFDKPLYEEHGICQYKYVDDSVLERTAAEIQIDIDALPVTISAQEKTDMAIAELTTMIAGLMTN
ncbi:MAG: hypothetical protein LKJ75_05160 [Clostridia bacterium]|jgi:hypothetical protein|nr:hypothetical protein [Clostridia bacterium]MCI2014572.1 hypothetical protein [Clostridia bacterium]